MTLLPELITPGVVSTDVKVDKRYFGHAGIVTFYI